MDISSPMETNSPNVMTPKQIAKYQRQQCINLLEKITKNLFRMFRNTEMKQSDVEERFSVLYTKLSEFKTVYLYSVYQREMRRYIEEVAKLIQSDRDIDDVRDNHMTRLNRIQKLKTVSKYKKEKHTQTFH